MSRGGVARRRLLILAVVVLGTAAVIVVMQSGDGDDEPSMTGPPVSTAARMATTEPPSNVEALARNVPPPEECRAAPRSAEALRAVLATPVAAPGAPAWATPEAGRPVDPETERAVLAVFREITACFNGGDYGRAFALATDDYTRRLLLAAAQATQIEPALVAGVVATPRPQLPMGWTAIVATGSVRAFPDGRVGAFVVTVKVADAATSEGTPQLMLFVQRDGRWLLDGSVSLADAATPAALASPVP